jgi:hypothetical protein
VAQGNPTTVLVVRAPDIDLPACRLLGGIKTTAGVKPILVDESTSLSSIAERHEQFTGEPGSMNHGMLGPIVYPALVAHSLLSVAPAT